MMFLENSRAFCSKYQLQLLSPTSMSSLVTVSSNTVFTVAVFFRLTDEKNSTYSVPALELKRSDIYRSFFHVSHSMSWASE